MLEIADAGTPRAFLRVGGVNVARQQLGLALALHCERIICLAHGMRPEIVALQHQAEAAGAQFHVVAGPRALLGLITATDEVIVLGDGLFASIPDAAALLEQGQAVIVQPIEQGLAAGFERIDLNNAAAGAMRIPGRLVEQIAELEPDCDAASALQRIALQAGTRQRPMPSAEGRQVFWTLIRNDAEAHALEPQWIKQRTRDDQPLNPSRAMALVLVRQLGPALLHAGSGSAPVAISSWLFALLAFAAGWLGFPATGLLICAIAWILREIASLLERIEGDAPIRQSGPLSTIALHATALDVLIIGLCGWSVSAGPWQPLAERFFPPFMLIALLRIISRAVQGRWTAWLADRALLAIALAVCIAGGIGSPAIHAGAVIAALSGIALSSYSRRLTRP